MVRVQEEILPNGVQPARGTKSRAELAMHNDAADILSLLCVYPAARAARASSRADPRRTTRSWPSGPTCSPCSTTASRITGAASSPTTSRTSRRTTSRSSRRSDGRICINFTYSSILPAMHALGREFTAEQKRTRSSFLRNILVDATARVALESGEAVCRQQLRAVPLAVGLRQQQRSRRRPVGSCARGWRCRVEDRRLPIGREYFHMENKDRRLGYDPVPGPRRSDRPQRLQERRPRLADMFKAAQAKPKVDRQ